MLVVVGGCDAWWGALPPVGYIRVCVQGAILRVCVLWALAQRALRRNRSVVE